MDDCVTIFLKTGCLGPLRLGMQKASILEAIGEPDSESRTSRKHANGKQLLLYGDTDKINLQLVLQNNVLSAIYLYFRGSNDLTSLPQWISVPSIPLQGTLSLNAFFDWAELARVPWRIHWPLTLADQTSLTIPSSSALLVWGHDPETLYVVTVSRD